MTPLEQFEHLFSWNSFASVKSTPVDQAKVSSPVIEIMPSNSRQFNGKLYLLPTVVYSFNAK